MKVININGIELYVCTEAEARKFGLTHTFSWPTVKLVTVPSINKRTLILLLGLDETKADYAVPQPWADAHKDWYEHIWPQVRWQVQHLWGTNQRDKRREVRIGGTSPTGSLGFNRISESLSSQHSMSYATYPSITKGGHQLLVDQVSAVEGLRQLDQRAVQKHMTITHHGVVVRLEDGSEHDANIVWQNTGCKCLGYYAFVIFEDGSRSGA